MKKISFIILSALVLLFVVTSHVGTPHAFAFDPQVFTASNVNLGDHSISFTLNPSDVSAFVSTYGTTNMDLRIVSTSNELQGWYNNNLDVTTCLTTGNCSFSGLAENIAPPGSSIQIGFFPDGHHENVIWSQFIVFSTPTPTPTPTPLIPQVFTASNVNLGDHSISFTFNPSDVSSFVAAHGTTNMDLRIVNSANELQGWYNNNLDVTTCLTTGNCSFSGLLENIAPPGSSIQIGFFPDGDHPDVIWSQVITSFNLNQPPSAGTITVSTNPVQVNSSTTASANFTDADTGDTHTASWNWGDGNTTTGTVTESNGSGSVSDSHTYSTAGVYTVMLTVTDNHGALGQSTYQYVSVYSPTAQGLFSAGQRFSNPGTASPSTSGNVTFGLAYKYQGTMPTSDRQFSMDFNAANLHFNAIDVTSLVVANSMATLTGTGTLTGRSGTFNFLVTGVNGGDIRIQITDPSSSNAVIYNTQPGAAATATPTTSVTGNVIAHN